MKKLLLLVAVAAMLFIPSSCSTEDAFHEDKVWECIGSIISRIEELEKICDRMNSDISSLQNLVKALENNDSITGVFPIIENGVEVGYEIRFEHSDTIFIYHGKDGSNGKNGYTPQIGVRQDGDGIYYWTLDGEWLLDEKGNKIKAVGVDGADGKDGQNGQDGSNGSNGTNGQDGKDGADGITPQLKIEDDYWYISYDNGATWTQLGKATGEDGKDGANGTGGAGDNIVFKSVTQDDNNVYFTLADGTVITVHKNVAFDIVFDTANIQDVKVHSEVKVNYEVSSSAEHVDIEVLPTNDLRAVLVPEDESNKCGYILIRTGSTFDAASRVVVIVSDGNKAIMKSLVLNIKPEEESAQLYVYNGATKTVSAKGGDVTVSFITNVDCKAVIPTEYQSWISVAETRALECKHIAISVAENTGDRRSGEVKVQTLDGKLSITYTISQVGASSTSSPEVGDDGTITATPASNEIFYTTTDGLPIEPSATAFNGVVVSNTYENGVGVIVLDRPFTIIMDEAFYGKKTLRSIVLPNTVTSIGVDAFEFCHKLTRIDITNLSAWCRISFGDNDANPLYYGAKLYLNGSELTDITIPSDITEIKNYTFYNNDSLTSVIIPDSVTLIGGSAFCGCDSLTSVTIGNGVTSIGEYAFNGCDSLTSVTIGNSVTSIGNLAFCNCTSLVSVTIGNSVTSIGGLAFKGCTSLTAIAFPDATKTIGGEAFYNCATLEKIEMGSGMKTISADAFWGCYLLKEIYCKAATPPTGHANMFVCAVLDAKIYVPTASVEAYKAAQYWSDYADYIEGKEF
ncbi:MAG: hypothetical protein E7129_04695 [Rikenellaceae bacterium]|nr:hypothetical protein [Rikenellaceae bacterium]